MQSVIFAEQLCLFIHVLAEVGTLPVARTVVLMGAIHKMAPVGVCGALLYTGACWMYGWLRAAEKNSPC